MLPSRMLTKRQVSIIRQIRAIILDVVAESGKTPGKTLQIAEIYRAIAAHLSTSVDRVIALGNDLVWAALYLIQLQGWIRLDPRLPRVRIIRQPRV